MGCGQAVCPFHLGDDDMQLGLGIILSCFKCPCISLFFYLILSLYQSVVGTVLVVHEVFNK